MVFPNVKLTFKIIHNVLSDALNRLHQIILSTHLNCHFNRTF